MRATGRGAMSQQPRHRRYNPGVLLGHCAPAFALKALAPRVPLWALVAGVYLLDILFAIFVLTGIEHARIVPGFTASNDLDLYDMPWSHSVLAGAVWAVLAGGLAAWLWPGARWRVGLAMAAAVLSHLALDIPVHVPDMTLAGNDTARLGLGLWNHRALAIAIEAGVLAAGVLVLARSSWAAAARRGRAVAGLGAAMMLLLIVSYVVPTPPAITPMVLLLLVTAAGLALITGLVVDRGASAASPASRPE
jgi:hypothetical protein